MAIFSVTNLNDKGAGSLRQAILNANARAGLDTITFQTGLAGTIRLTSGELVITDSVSIQGTSADQLTINGNNASRIFNISNGDAFSYLSVYLTGFTLTGGRATQGGAIFEDGENVTLARVKILGNTATGQGGGIYSSSNDGTLEIQQSVIANNTASIDGGGVFLDDGILVVQNSTIANNRAAGGTGGGIHIDDTELVASLIENTVLSGNTAQTNGGGLYIRDTDVGITLQNATVLNNTANGDGGGFFIQGSDHAINLNQSEISGNRAAGSGGGLYLFGNAVGILTLQNSVLANNTNGSTGNDLKRASGTINATNTLVENGANAINGSNTRTIAGQNPPAVTLSLSPNRSFEGGARFVYTFTRSGSTNNSLAVNFTVGGSAVVGSSNDFTQSGAQSFSPTNGQIVIPAGQKTAKLTLAPRIDGLIEGDETISIQLATGLYLKGTTNAVSATIAGISGSPSSTPPLGAAPPPISFNGGQPGLTQQGSNGRDRILGSVNNDTLRGKGGSDKLQGKDGNDQLVGGGGNDQLSGQSGNDQLSGQGGNDVLKGGLGLDELNGGNGSDRLLGQSGQDVLIGGLGNDILAGGSDADLFVFTSVNDGTDTIADFNTLEDLIDLRTIFATTPFSAPSPFAQFSQFLSFEQSGANTLLKIDADGNGSSSVQAILAVLQNVAIASISPSRIVIA